MTGSTRMLSDDVYRSRLAVTIAALRYWVPSVAESAFDAADGGLVDFPELRRPRKLLREHLDPHRGPRAEPLQIRLDDLVVVV